MSNLYLLLYLIFIRLRIWHDSDFIEEDKSPVHWVNAILVCLFAYVPILMNPRPLWFTIPFFLYLYFYVFDAGLNMALGRPIQAIGKTAVTDKIERWILGNDEEKFGMWFIMKTILFIGLVGVYIADF